jgi:hypothetical protein
MGQTTPVPIFGPDTTTPQGAAGVAPGTCSASGLRVVLETALAADVSFTLQRGPSIPGLADTTLACTVATGATACDAGLAIVPIAAGDLVVFRSDAGDIGSDSNVFFGWLCR